MEGDRQKPEEGAAGMFPPIADPRTGGQRRVDLGQVLPGSCPGNAPFRAGDMGSETPHGEEPGGIAPPSGAMDCGTTPPVSS